MTDAERTARICKVLSVPSRVRIVQLLKSRDLCVGALSGHLGITQGAVSQHLRVLRDAGLVAPHKQGYYVHYRLEPKAVAKWKALIERLLESESAGPKRRAAQRRKQGRKPCVVKRRVVSTPKD